MARWGAFLLFGVSLFGADERFEAQVRPLLVEKCFPCHTAAKMGGLRLDSRELLLKGGKSGAAVVPGDPEGSLIVKALRTKMPPTGRLKDEQIASIVAWIREGARWPAAHAGVAGSDFWSFRPVVAREGSIDGFIREELAAKGLKQVRPATKRELIRRATYDLTGLPPTAEEVAAFERDRAAGAFERVVDRLLASPRYGERQARLWLDVARYSDDRLDSERDNSYPNSFWYRDWVIQAMQADMPYDVFVKAQIAGDRMPEREKYEAGLGFYALSPEFQDDRVDATTRGFLGLTVACAQCHDHKYDPIPTRDFYSLLGIFRNTELGEVPLASKEVVERYKAKDEAIKAKDEELKEFLARQAKELSEILAVDTAKYLMGEGADAETQARWKKYLDKPEKDHPYLKAWSAGKSRAVAEEFQAALLKVIADKNRVDDENHIRLGLNPSRNDFSNADLVALPRDRYVLWKDVMGEKGVLYYDGAKIERFLSGVWKGHLARLRGEVAALKKELPPAYPFLQVIQDRAKWEEQKVWIRGNEGNPGEVAPPRFLTVLAGGDQRFPAGRERLALAESIANAKNPLTARVMVNRIWRQHFGQGIVRTPSNFGNLGDRPSHPELLDLLAARFVREGWSIKKLHKVMMLSAAYALGGENLATNYAVDPDNRLLWRHNRRRLDAESIRDSMLAVSGKLDLAIGGAAKRLETDNARRTVYGYVSRRRLDPMLGLFDFPNPNNTSEQRMETTVPLQKLFFMNSGFVTAQARALAERVCSGGGSEDERVRRVYRVVLQREPLKDERRAGVEFVRGGGKWSDYAQVLLSSNEFIYLE